MNKHERAYRNDAEPCEPTIYYYSWRLDRIEKCSKNNYYDCTDK